MVKKKREYVLCCDFCGLYVGYVQTLIESPVNTHICEKCVAVCVEMLNKPQAVDAVDRHVPLLESRPRATEDLSSSAVIPQRASGEK